MSAHSLTAPPDETAGRIRTNSPAPRMPLPPDGKPEANCAPCGKVSCRTDTSPPPSRSGTPALPARTHAEARPASIQTIPQGRRGWGPSRAPAGGAPCARLLRPAPLSRTGLQLPPDPVRGQTIRHDDAYRRSDGEVRPPRCGRLRRPRETREGQAILFGDGEDDASDCQSSRSSRGESLESRSGRRVLGCSMAASQFAKVSDEFLCVRGVSVVRLESATQVAGHHRERR